MTEQSPALTELGAEVYRTYQRWQRCINGEEPGPEFVLYQAYLDALKAWTTRPKK